MTNFWLKRQYAETSTEPDGLAKRGYVYLLAEETHYLMSFENLGNQPTVLHLNLGWSEGEPSARPLWTS